VFLQSEIAEEAGDFSLNDVVAGLATKLIRRHPHVFADVAVSGAADVEANWEALKKAEKGERRSVLDGVPKSLPALMMAAELQKRMRKTGFAWPNRQAGEAKLAEELAEVQQAATPAEAAAELGDVLFVLTELATWYGANAEEALRNTNTKVEARFRYLEERVRERGVAIKDVPLDGLLALWHEAKTRDRQPA
jgi:tetrapyrrole methylase family protein/MazG family protein